MEYLHLLTKARKVVGEFTTSRESTLSGRQRLTVFLYGSVILIGVIPLILFAFGEYETLFVLANIALWCITLVILVLYLTEKISLSLSLNLLVVFVQLEIVLEMFYCASVPYANAPLMLLTNVFLSSVVILLSSFAYLPYLPYLLSVLVMGAYFYGMVALNSAFLINFSPVFCFVFFLICLFSNSLLKNIRLLEKENEGLRTDEKELLTVLRLNKAQVNAFVQLCKTKSPDNAGDLLDLIGPKARYNIINVVSAHNRSLNIKIEELEKAFPLLTPMELQISALILQGKKQSEICGLLSKSPENVNSRRSHIRKKLGLRANQDLKTELQRGLGLS